MSAEGVVIGESGKPPDQLLQIENHLQRPEVQDAIKHGAGSATAKEKSMTVKMDVPADFPAVRAGSSLSENQRRARRSRLTLLARRQNASKM